MKKRLKRNSKDIVIGGVCGGIANYFDTDPTIVRVITALLLFLSFGLVFFLYIILWIITPINTKK